MDWERKSILYDKNQIDQRVKELANTISRDYEGRDLVLVGILKGAFIFLADLSRSLSIPHSLDFARLASYGSQAKSSGIIEIRKDIEMPVKEKDVILVEDIIDTGTTLAFFTEKIMQRNPRSVKICTLIDKKERREVECNAHYVGFSVERGFIVGYGLDFNEKYRYLPDIYTIDESTR